MHTFILRIYIHGIQLQEQRYHISGIAVPIYWNGGAIPAGFFIKLMTQEVKEYSDDLVRGLLEKIIVNADRLVIEFKSGTEIEIEA